MDERLYGHEAGLAHKGEVTAGSLAGPKTGR
jgi:hypothetical protein